MTGFYSSINSYFVKLLFLINFIPDFVGIRQCQTGILLSDNASIYRNVDAIIYGIDFEASYKWSDTWRSSFTAAFLHKIMFFIFFLLISGNIIFIFYCLLSNIPV